MRKVLTIALYGFMLVASVFIAPPDRVYGWFTTGQDAAILWNGFDFDNAGYLNTAGDGLFFNHPMNLATDGTRLLLADTRNNRLLIWNTLPSGNVSPDLVLGQDNLTTNNPGSGLNNLNWPVGVSSANGKVVVSDTYNHRVLIWNTFPTANAQPAGLYINLKEMQDPPNPNLGEWPWGVWTNGTKLVVTVTSGSKVLIWNTFPTVNNQPPDLILRGKSPTDGTNRFGTPRTIGTDGTSYLVIGDHNAIESNSQGSFFWRSFPNTDNQPYDFFMANPHDSGQMMWGGEESWDGKFITVSAPGISIWNSFPSGAGQQPDLFVGRQGGGGNERCTSEGYYFNDGDGSHLALTPSGRLYISLYNGNKIVGYHSLPTATQQCPDFVIGSPDLATNSYLNYKFIDNTVPATNGTSLFVTSDFNSRLHVWRSIPAQSGSPPDIVYDLNFGPWDNALYENTFVIAGGQKVQIWTSLPLNGNPPDIAFDGGIGSVTFQDIKGVALDGRYLYIADNGANKLYVWNALPNAGSSPIFSLDIQNIWQMKSNGQYLAVVRIYDHKIMLYRVDELSSSATPVAEIPSNASYRFNLPQGTLIADNGLFIADTGFSRVVGWRSIDDAINGNPPDVVLGQQNLQDTSPAIGQNRLFWPRGLALHGNKLWVGEFKFSGRLLAFSSTIFFDVSSTHWAYNYIMAIYNNHITTGCSQNPLKYCPDTLVSRDQMAAFIVRAKEGEPSATYCSTGSPFSDVDANHWACRYIKRLYELGITTGCAQSPLRYCPDNGVSRDQMAAFIVRAKEGEPAQDYCGSGSPFSDVDSNHWACKYIKRLYELGVTTGCAQNPLRYCPNNIVSRDQMAAFLARAFLGMQ